MTYGTIPRFQLMAQGAAFVTLDDHNEGAFTIAQGPFGDLDWACYKRWASWPTPDPNFVSVAFGSIAASDFEVAQDILVSGGIWNNPISSMPGAPTWAQLAAGASFTGSDGHPYTGSQAVSRCLGEWLIKNTVAIDEAAVKDAYWSGTVLAGINAIAGPAFAAMVTPPPPATPVPAQTAYPPEQVGLIQSAMGLDIAEATLIAATKSPTNGNVPVIGILPIPQ